MSDNLNTIGIRGKIAARTPDYRYTLPEGGNPGDIPVKTETGVEWQKPEPATTTPDWSQNDEAASDYIKNRPGGYTVNYPALNIEWDGVIGDRVVVDLYGSKFVKVSDEIPKAEQLVGGTLSFKEGDTSNTISITDDRINNLGDGACSFGDEGVSVNKAPANFVDPDTGAVAAVFPETGVYFMYDSYDGNDMYTSSLTLPAKSVIVPIPDKYIRQYILADDSLIDLTTDINMRVNLVIATRASLKLKMNSGTFVYVVAGNEICTVTDSSGLVAGFIPSGMMGKVNKGRSLVSVSNQDYGIYKQIQVTKGESLPNGISVGEGGVPVILSVNDYRVNSNTYDGGFVGIAILESRGRALLQKSGSVTVKIRTNSLTTYTDVLELVTKADEGKLVRLCAFNDSNASFSNLTIVKYKAENSNSRLAKILSVDETSGTAEIWLY